MWGADLRCGQGSEHLVGGWCLHGGCPTPSENASTGLPDERWVIHTVIHDVDSPFSSVWAGRWMTSEAVSHDFEAGDDGWPEKPRVVSACRDVRRGPDRWASAGWTSSQGRVLLTMREPPPREGTAARTGGGREAPTACRGGRTSSACRSPRQAGRRGRRRAWCRRRRRRARRSRGGGQPSRRRDGRG